MKKTLKWLTVIAAIGTLIGIVIVIFCKNRSADDRMDFDLEDEDFDLDSDLQAVDREYVPLKKSEGTVPVSESNETTSEETSDTADTEKDSDTTVNEKETSAE